MRKTAKTYWIFVLLFSIFASCRSQTTVKQNTDTSKSVPKNLPNHEPNFNYMVEVPESWATYDTVIQEGLKIRFLFPQEQVQPDLPTGNILITWMDGNDIDDFTDNNIRYLKANMQGITILEKGSIDSTEYGGQWYTYTKEQNGINRDMINYIIPYDGFAYMITCGCNKGSMEKYREAFDKIAKSFKI